MNNLTLRIDRDPEFGRRRLLALKVQLTGDLADAGAQVRIQMRPCARRSSETPPATYYSRTISGGNGQFRPGDGHATESPDCIQ
jgi:hypothetical protein